MVIFEATFYLFSTLPFSRQLIRNFAREILNFCGLFCYVFLTDLKKEGFFLSSESFVILFFVFMYVPRLLKGAWIDLKFLFIYLYILLIYSFDV